MTVKKEQSSTLNEVFLGKKGKVFGPYTREEFENLHATKKLEDFTYLWNSESESWTPLEAVPPHPHAKAEGKIKGAKRGLDWNALRAFCHNYIQGVGGRLEGVTETGCDLLVREGHDHPRFAQHVPLLLNLMDVEQGKSWNIKVTLSQSERRNDEFVYRMRWDKMPTLA